MVRICFLIVSSTVGSGVDYEGDSSVGEGRSEVYGVGDYDGGVDGEGNFFSFCMPVILDHDLYLDIFVFILDILIFSLEIILDTSWCE
ncbi:hypothetical protein Tco_0506709 [Tanacetum coccineum]